LRLSESLPELPLTIRQALRWARDVLASVGAETPDLDAEILLAYNLGQTRAWLYAHPELDLTPESADAYVALVQRRAVGEPVAYITGHKEFFGLDFIVTPAVLIPRPESELLVEICLGRLAKWHARCTIVDVGTGSGVLAVTLAVHLPGAHLIAVDLSSTAVAVARRNAVRHGVADRVSFVVADLVEPLSVVADVIVANLPYLCRDEMPGDVSGGEGEAGPDASRPRMRHPLAWEPRAALDGGPDGLHWIRRLLWLAGGRLRRGGVLVVEMGAGQGATLLSLARQLFPEAEVAVYRDYAGLDRVLVVSEPAHAADTLDDPYGAGLHRGVA
jgi:release factor glutamine methyltransferase